MKKLIFTILLALTIWSCSNNDDNYSNCQSNIDAINAKYDKQIQQAKDNPGTTGIDYRQISLLNQERNKKLESACN